MRGEYPVFGGTRNARATGKALDYSLGDVRAADGRTIWVNAEEKGVVPIFRLNGDGSDWKAVHSSGTSTGLDVRGDSVVFVSDTTSRRPNELFALDAKTGAARQLTHFNDETMKGFTLGKVEPCWFKGADGADVHGWLVLPPNYDPAKKYPLVQLLHGGPHTMDATAGAIAGTRSSSPRPATSSRGSIAMAPPASARSSP